MYTNHKHLADSHKFKLLLADLHSLLAYILSDYLQEYSLSEQQAQLSQQIYEELDLNESPKA